MHQPTRELASTLQKILEQASEHIDRASSDHDIHRVYGITDFLDYLVIHVLDVAEGLSPNTILPEALDMLTDHDPTHNRYWEGHAEGYDEGREEIYQNAYDEGYEQKVADQEEQLKQARSTISNLERSLRAAADRFADLQDEYRERDQEVALLELERDSLMNECDNRSTALSNEILFRRERHKADLQLMFEFGYEKGIAGRERILTSDIADRMHTVSLRELDE